MAMNQKQRQEDEATQEDLRELLIEFWLGTMQNADAEVAERIKASEFLAKFILHDGQTSVRSRRGPPRPPTAEVLRLVGALESEHEGE